MKILPWRTACTLAIFTTRLSFAQPTDAPALNTSDTSNSVTPAARPSSSTWQAAPIDWMSTEWKRTEIVTNAAKGTMEPVVRRYIEVSSGLNYITDQGAWARSADLIQIITNATGEANGAAALQ